MKGVSLTLNNQLVFDKEFRNREEKRQVNEFLKGVDQRIFKMLLFTVAAVGFASKRVLADTGEALDKIDMLGGQLLYILQRVGFWVAVIGCITEILISVFKKGGGQKEIIGLVFKWLIIFTTFYAVPFLFNFIIEAFL